MDKDMDRRIYLNNLYDYYKGLFTEKQQEYFEEYYYNNLSLSEIAENNNVSRNAVHNQVKIVETRLEELENILGLYKKKEQIIDLIFNEVSEQTLEKVENQKIINKYNTLNQEVVDLKNE